VLHSVNVAVLGALFNWGATPRPSNIGVQDYGGGLKTLGLCPPSPNCISTAEEANDPEHYVPQWWVLPACWVLAARRLAAACLLGAGCWRRLLAVLGSHPPHLQGTQSPPCLTGMASYTEC
jgi:hypothetical protein